MFGSIFYNLWGALIAFSIYFLVHFKTIYASANPDWLFYCSNHRIFVMFIVRFLIAYILFTPEEDEEAVEVDIEEKELESIEGVKQEVPIANSTVEFQDENSEEIAQVVRTMMNREEDQQVNA